MYNFKALTSIIAAVLLTGCATTHEVVDTGQRAPEPCPVEATAKLQGVPTDPSTEKERADLIAGFLALVGTERTIVLMEYYQVSLPGYATRLYNRMAAVQNWCEARPEAK